jgi:hypothetical protein
MVPSNESGTASFSGYIGLQKSNCNNQEEEGERGEEKVRGDTLLREHCRYSALNYMSIYLFNNNKHNKHNNDQKKISKTKHENKHETKTKLKTKTK